MLSFRTCPYALSADCSQIGAWAGWALGVVRGRFVLPDAESRRPGHPKMREQKCLRADEGWRKAKHSTSVQQQLYSILQDKQVQDKKKNATTNDKNRKEELAESAEKISDMRLTPKLGNQGQTSGDYETLQIPVQQHR